MGDYHELLYDVFRSDDEDDVDSDDVIGVHSGSDARGTNLNPGPSYPGYCPITTRDRGSLCPPPLRGKREGAGNRCQT